MAQLFPALRRLDAAARLLEREARQPGSSQVRALAEAALRELLLTLARERPVVLWIDDLQWGDLDSAGIISSWLTSPQLPSLLLVLSYRSEELATSPCLALLQRHGLSDTLASTRLALRALREDDVRALAQRRLHGSPLTAAAQHDATERIVREAQGSPFLAAQLAEVVATQPSWGAAELADLGLEQLMRIRSDTLSPGARRLLHLLSVAGRPIPLSLAIESAENDSGARALIHELRGQLLIRTRDVSHERLLETYHDRLASDSS